MGQRRPKSPTKSQVPSAAVSNTSSAHRRRAAGSRRLTAAGENHGFSTWRVQKSLAIPDDLVQRLRRAKLIEGQRPRLRVAASVAAVTGGRAEYIRNRPQDDAHYAKLTTDYLERFGSASRHDIDELLLGKLSDALTDTQKATKTSTLLAKMKRSGQITNEGSRTKPSWGLRV